MLDWIRFLLTAGFLAVGLFLMMTGVIAQFRFYYVLNRMHAASMSDSLGLLMVAAGLCVSAPDGWVIAKLLLTALFLWITSPTASHLIARLEVTLNEHIEDEMEVSHR